MADFGVGEALAATAAKGAETLGAGAVGADLLAPAAIADAAGATLIPEIATTAGSIGAGAEGVAAGAGALGAGAEALTAGGGAAAGLGAADFASRFVGSQTPSGTIDQEFGNLLPPSAAADASPLPVFNLDGTPTFTPEQNATVTGINNQLGLQPLQPAPGSAATPGGASASSIAPPQGVDTAGLDPTSTGSQSLDKLSTPTAGATTPSTATPGAAAPTTSPSSGGFGSDLLKGAEKSITGNPLGIALAGAGLLTNLMKGNQLPSEADTLKNQASQLAAQGSQLASYLQSGTLPPGIKTAVDQATQAAKARVISNYAGRGQPTDPSKNSALAQELNSIDEQAVISTSQIGQQLLTSGISETQLSSNIYESLLKIDQTQQQQTGQAIANFAAALGGGARANVGGKQITVT